MRLVVRGERKDWDLMDCERFLAALEGSRDVVRDSMVGVYRSIEAKGSGKVKGKEVTGNKR